MARRRRRRRKKSTPSDGDGKKRVEIKYPEDLIMAVKYLLEKGFNSREVADRLEISPYTVRNIKRVLRKRGLLAPQEGQEEEPAKKVAVVRSKSKKSKDVIEEILGGGE